MIDTEIVLEYIKSRGPMCSWDWDADSYFARRATGISDDTKEVLDKLLEHHGIAPVEMRWHDVFIRRAVTARRLRAARKLIKQGKLTADWGGTGPGGRTDFGIVRTRVYSLATGNKQYR